MKFILTNLMILFTSVGLLLYLFATKTFLPYDNFGNSDVLNISVFVFLSFLIVSTSVILLTWLVLFLLNKRKEVEERRDIKTISFIAFKYGIIFSLGLLAVVILNFFNVLDWAWGLAVLVVVFVGLIII